MLDSKKINFIQFEYGPSNIHFYVLFKDILNFLINKKIILFFEYIRPLLNQWFNIHVS